MQGNHSPGNKPSISLPFHLNLKALEPFCSFVSFFHSQSSKSHVYRRKMKSMAHVIQCMHIKLLICVIGSILDLFQTKFYIFGHKVVSNDFSFFGRKFHSNPLVSNRNVFKNELFEKFLLNLSCPFVSYDLRDNRCRFRESKHEICWSNTFEKLSMLSNSMRFKIRNENCTNNGNSFTFFEYISNRWVEYIIQKRCKIFSAYKT